MVRAPTIRMPATSIAQYYASTTRSAGASVPSTPLATRASREASGNSPRYGGSPRRHTFNEELTVGGLRLIRPWGAALARVDYHRATPTRARGRRIRCRSSRPLKSAPRRPAFLGERRRQQRSPRSASSMATSGQARSTPCKRSSRPSVDSLPRRPPSGSSR